MASSGQQHYDPEFEFNLGNPDSEGSFSDWFQDQASCQAGNASESFSLSPMSGNSTNFEDAESSTSFPSACPKRLPSLVEGHFYVASKAPIISKEEAQSDLQLMVEQLEDSVREHEEQKREYEMKLADMEQNLFRLQDAAKKALEGQEADFESKMDSMDASLESYQNENQALRDRLTQAEFELAGRAAQIDELENTQLRQEDARAPEKSLVRTPLSSLRANNKSGFKRVYPGRDGRWRAFNNDDVFINTFPATPEVEAGQQTGRRAAAMAVKECRSPAQRIKQGNKDRMQAFANAQALAYTQAGASMVSGMDFLIE